MATPEGQRLTLAHQQQVLRLAELIARRLGVTARRADVSDIDGWWDSISGAVQEEILAGQTALARLARGYLVAHSHAEGATVRPVVVEPDPQQVATSLRVTGPVAFKTHMAISGSADASGRVMTSQLRGAAQRLLLESDRQTITRTVQANDSVAGWRRTGAGRSCPFCLMLIGRGAVYSKRTATFESHDRCNCAAEPLYRREPEPPEIRRLQQQWREATAGTTGAGAIRAWRAFLAAQGRSE
jgi:hypothetical protein